MSKHTRADYSHSFTDLMASLAVIFLILAGGVTVLLTLKAKSVAKNLQTTEDAVVSHVGMLSKALESILEKVNLPKKVKSEGNIVRVFFNSQDRNKNSLFFALNDFKLGEQQATFVRTTVKEIVKEACLLRFREQSKLNLIVLEGHTDSSANPLGEGCFHNSSLSAQDVGFCNNVRLSARRATEVFFHLRDAISREKNLASCVNELFLVSGRGSSAPFSSASQSNNTVNEEDRRVELVFHIVPRFSGEK